MSSASTSWPRAAVILAYTGLLLLGTSTSLEGQTTYTFTPYITSGFASHSMLTTISVVSSIMNSTLKAPVAKIAEVFGRLEALIILMILYAIGFICMSQADSVKVFAASQIFYMAGFTGTLMLIQLIVADTSSLVNRTLVSIMPSLPFLWTVWAGPALGQKILNTIGWRWGEGMWAIIIPACSLPVAIALFWVRNIPSKSSAQNGGDEDLENAATSTTTLSSSEPPVSKASDNKLMSQNSMSQNPMSQKAMSQSEKKFDWKTTLDQLDIPGIILLAGGLCLLLIPLTIPQQGEDGPIALWKSWRTWLYLISGVILLTIFVWYDGCKAHYPVLSLKSIKCRTIACLAFAEFFSFMAFYIFDSMFVSFLQVARFRTAQEAGHIQNCYSFASTASAVLAGFLIKAFKKNRIIIWVGAFLNLLGILLMIPFRAPGHHIAWLIMCQTIIGIGGGLFGTPAMVNAQSWAAPQDVGQVTALYLTSGPLGGSFGSAIAGAVWSSSLKTYLRQYLPEDQWNLIPGITASIVTAMSYPEGSDTRTAIVQAYSQVMKRLCWIAGGVGIVYFALALLAREAKFVPTKHTDTEETAPQEGVMQRENGSAIIANSEPPVLKAL